MLPIILSGAFSFLGGDHLLSILKLIKFVHLFYCIEFHLVKLFFNNLLTFSKTTTLEL